MAFLFFFPATWQLEDDYSSFLPFSCLGRFMHNGGLDSVVSSYGQLDCIVDALDVHNCNNSWLLYYMSYDLLL